MKKTDNTAITHSDGATTLTGDAIELFRWMHVKQALVMYNKSGMLMTKGATPSKVLMLASGITKKKYKNDKAGREQAIADLELSISALKAAIPQVDERSMDNSK